jgi:hypothetical protein
VAGRIDPAIADRLLTAAVAAPSAHNRQTLAICRSGGCRLEGSVSHTDGQPACARMAWRTATIPDDVARRSWFVRMRASLEAPLLILVCFDIRDMDQYPV